jgi:hypothetical protein
MALPHGGQRKITVSASPLTANSVSLRHRTHGPLMMICPVAIGVMSPSRTSGGPHSIASLRSVLSTARPPSRAIPRRELDHAIPCRDHRLPRTVPVAPASSSSGSSSDTSSEAASISGVPRLWLELDAGRDGAASSEDRSMPAARLLPSIGAGGAGRYRSIQPTM